MITTNVLRRTFRIKYGDSCGTGFTIDVDDKQYIITARHVVDKIANSDFIEVFYSSEWRQLPVKIIGSGQEKIDIIVMSTDFQLSANYSLPPSEDGLGYGQDVYFLGFPYNLFTDHNVFSGTDENSWKFPAPFIKKAIVSGFLHDAGAKCWFLDGHNNPGFSGGPVVFSKPGTYNYSVAAVISGYRFDPQPVYLQGNPTPLEYRYNTGIIITYGISHALDLIRSNPSGFPVNSS